MRLSRLRFRFWIPLIVGALVAISLGIGVEVMRRRRANFLEQAAHYANRENYCQRIINHQYDITSCNRNQIDQWENYAKRFPPKAVPKVVLGEQEFNMPRTTTRIVDYIITH